MNGNSSAAYTPTSGRVPCKDCPDRTQHCHSKCEKYLAYKDWRAARVKELRLRASGDIACAEFAKRYMLEQFKHRRK